MPVKNKNRQSNSGYEGVITGLNDEEKKVLEDAGIGGGDIWLDITPYVNEDMTAISQEGYDLVWNAFYIASENPVNKYIGILFPDVNKAIFSGFVMHGDIFKIKFSVSADTDDEGRVQYDIFISSDKSISISTSAANGIWYKLDSLSFLNNVTQTQYDEIKTLATNGQLAGITDNNLYCPLYLIIGGAMGFQIPWTENGYISNNFFTIKEDLSVSLTDITPLVCPKTNPTSQVIPSINTANEQQNLTVGDGLVIENGALKPNKYLAIDNYITITSSTSGTISQDGLRLISEKLAENKIYEGVSFQGLEFDFYQYLLLSDSCIFYGIVDSVQMKLDVDMAIGNYTATPVTDIQIGTFGIYLPPTPKNVASKLYFVGLNDGELQWVQYTADNTLSNRVDNLEGRVDSLTNEVSQYSGSISSLESRVSSLETASTSYAQASDVSTLDSRVSNIETTIGDINSILDNINGEVI